MEPILRDAFPDWATDSAIFDELTGMPWDDDVESEELNLEYFGNHSGAKFCAPLVKHYLDNNGEITSAGKTALAKVIESKYKVNWTKLWETMFIEYSPVDNYDMTETLERQQSNESHEQTDEEVRRNEENVKVLGSVDSTTHGRNVDDTTYKYGFNSPPEDENPSDLVESRESGTTSVQHTGADTVTNNGDETAKAERQNAAFEAEGSVMHRKGNIGVTTNQKLLTDEHELWKWNFFEQVFKDIDTVLALKIYDVCRV